MSVRDIRCTYYSLSVEAVFELPIPECWLGTLKDLNHLRPYRWKFDRPSLVFKAACCLVA